MENIYKRRSIKEIYKTYNSLTKTIYGTTTKGEPHIYDLINHKTYLINKFPFALTKQGWFTLTFWYGNYYDISLEFTHPIYYINQMQTGYYDILEINYNKQYNDNIISEYTNIDINDIMNIIGIDFNGLLWYNDELDINQLALNIFRSQVDKNFDINVAKKCSSIKDYLNKLDENEKLSFN